MDARSERVWSRGAQVPVNCMENRYPSNTRHFAYSAYADDRRDSARKKQFVYACRREVGNFELLRPRASYVEISIRIDTQCRRAFTTKCTSLPRAAHDILLSLSIDDIETRPIRLS